REVDTLARAMKLNYFLCGAMARDILLKHVHGIETGRATSDVDFAVAVKDWEQFEEIKTRLTETGKFEAATNTRMTEARAVMLPQSSSNILCKLIRASPKLDRRQAS